jgi:hypothetical protein
MVGPDHVLGTFDPIVEDIKSEYTKTVPDVREKVRGMRTLFRRLCAQLAPEARPEDLCPPDREEEQISRIVDGKDMKGGLKYAAPAVIAGTRPVGAITPRQHDIIRDGMKRCGYTNEIAQAVVANRVGKPDVGALTKAEAAQIIAYLATPGAAWAS